METNNEMNLPFTMFVVSDLHLEFCKKPIDKYVNMIPDADVLVLAGDIGMPNKKHFKRFLKLCDQSGKHTLILFVPGNHEYWSEYNDTEIEEICVHYDVIMLQNELVVFNDVVFIGSTLWTSLSPLPPQIELLQMNDFHRIPELNVSKWKQLHKTSITTIKKHLDDEFTQNKKCIIITHHAPSIHCIPKEYHNDPLNSCYYSNLQGLFEYKNLVAWIFGHTHKSLSKLVGLKKNTLLFGNSGRTPGSYDLKYRWNDKQDNIWNEKYIKDIKESE